MDGIDYLNAGLSMVGFRFHAKFCGKEAIYSEQLLERQLVQIQFPQTSKRYSQSDAVSLSENSRNLKNIPCGITIILPTFVGLLRDEIH